MHLIVSIFQPYPKGYDATNISDYDAEIERISRSRLKLMSTLSSAKNSIKKHGTPTFYKSTSMALLILIG
jgi:hypothetical protein